MAQRSELPSGGAFAQSQFSRCAGAGHSVSCNQVTVTGRSLSTAGARENSTNDRRPRGWVSTITAASASECQAKARSRCIVSSAKRSTSSAAFMARAGAADCPDVRAVHSRSPVSPSRAARLCCADRKRLQSRRHKVVDQLIADIPTRPPTDHVGDDGTGIVRLGEGEVRDEWLSRAENLAALADLPGQWIDKVHHRRPPKKIVLDMASSESPTYGDQEGSAYNGHFGCTCYHPAFVFNQLGDV